MLSTLNYYNFCLKYSTIWLRFEESEYIDTTPILATQHIIENFKAQFHAKQILFPTNIITKKTQLWFE